MPYKPSAGFHSTLYATALVIIVMANWLLGLAFALRAIGYAGVILLFPIECGLWSWQDRASLIPIIYGGVWLGVSLRAFHDPARIKWLILWAAGGLLISYIPHIIPSEDPCHGQPYDASGERKSGNFWSLN